MKGLKVSPESIMGNKAMGLYDIMKIPRRRIKPGVIEVKPDVQIQETAVKNNIDSMHRAMMVVLVVAQCFAICPVKGITGNQAEDLRFTWKSLMIVYQSIALIGILISLGFRIIWFGEIGFNFQTSSDCVFHLVSVICCILFLKLARKWPQFALMWQKIERKQIVYGYPKNLHKKITTVSTLILALAFVEHLLAQISSWKTAGSCTSGTMERIRMFVMLSSPPVFKVLGYNFLTAIYSLFINTATAFNWSFIDLFVITISICLASRFRVLNQHLKTAMGKDMSEGFWKKIREDYNDLSLLTKTLDNHISGLVLLSVSSNLFYICQQLYNSMTNTVTVVDTIYFYVSFGFLLGRAIAVNLYASSIYDESTAAKNVLYAVPPNNYHVEVHRFLVQISTDSIALTGLNFFPVTRTLLLTLAGTVVTYEVVLVQFHTPIASTVKNLREDCLELHYLL